MSLLTFLKKASEHPVLICVVSAAIGRFAQARSEKGREEAARQKMADRRRKLDLKEEKISLQREKNTILRKAFLGDPDGKAKAKPSGSWRVSVPFMSSKPR